MRMIWYTSSNDVLFLNILLWTIFWKNIFAIMLFLQICRGNHIAYLLTLYHKANVNHTSAFFFWSTFHSCYCFGWSIIFLFLCLRQQTLFINCSFLVPKQTEIKWNYQFYQSENGHYELQKQPPRGVSKKRCSENMQQIYRRTPMPKCDFNKVALQLYWNRTSTWVFSCNFASYLQCTFS